MKKDNLLLIVGAGGGIEIGMPSTKKITEDIVNSKCFKHFKKEEEYDLISLVWNDVIKKKDTYEDLINKLEDLNTEAGYIFNDDPSQDINIDITQYLSIYCNIDKPLKLTWDLVDKTILAIYKKIFFKIYKSWRKFSFDDTHRWYKYFWKRINEAFNLNVLTTNYDNSYKTVLEEFNDGFSEPVVGYDGVFRFNPQEFHQKISEKPILMNIHGSIHYGFFNEKEEQEEIDLYYFEEPIKAYNTWSTKANHNRSQGNRCFKKGPFIAGLNKMNKIIISPCFFYLASLYKLILSCNKMLIIGYSFSDIHVNWYIKKFKEIHGKNSKIIYVTYVKEFNDNRLKWIRLSKKQQNFLEYIGDSWNNLKHSINNDQLSLSDTNCCALWFAGFKSFAENGLEERLEFLGLKQK